MRSVQFNLLKLVLFGIAAILYVVYAASSGVLESPEESPAASHLGSIKGEIERANEILKLHQ